MLKFVFPLAALPCAALAECPTGADLSTGIRVLGGDDTVETYQSQGPHIVRNDFYFEPGQGSQNLLARGVYLVQSIAIEDRVLDPKSRRTYTYPLTPEMMPDPTPGGQWVAPVAALEDGTLGTQVHSMQFGEQTSLTLGACTYRMVPIRVEYDSDPGYVETLYHLPDLGFALFGASQDADGTVETYSFLSIEKVTK